MATAARDHATAEATPTLAGTLSGLKASLPEWWPVYAGLAILFGPTFYDLFTGAWIGEEQGHGPIIFFLALWLIWRKWPELMAAVGPTPSGSWTGWPVLAIGLVFHLLGRSQKILMFEVASIVVVMAALVLLPVERYPDPARAREFYRRLDAALVGLPGGARSGIASNMPLDWEGPWRDFHIAGRKSAERDQMPRGRWSSVSPSYFATLGLPILTGRGFTAKDADVMRSVCPSGIAFATSSAPMMPLAPGRLSTTKGCPI